MLYSLKTLLCKSKSKTKPQKSVCHYLIISASLFPFEVQLFFLFSLHLVVGLP